MPLDRRFLCTDAQIWGRAAAAVLEFAAQHGLDRRQLQSLTWLVPNGAHATLARAALRERIGPAAFLPPRILPLASWLGQPMDSGIDARADLFSALRGNAWVREAFGEQPAALWALASGISHLADELTLAAVDGVDAFAARLRDTLARHFRRRAARVLQPQAQLVLQVWRARGEQDGGPAAALRALRARADAADGPIVFQAERLLDGEIAPWAQAFLQRCSTRVPVLLIAPDLRAALADRPTLAAAWPELSGADASIPIAVRSDRIRAGGTAPPNLCIVAAATLEEEATAVAQQVLDWRRDGVGSIALVALDRLTARRVRALLERAQVSVRDETGWKLSTTSAAAAVMRWLDLVADDLYWRDLLDWLKSVFTLADRADKDRLVAVFDEAVRAGGALQGAQAIRRALAELGERSPDDAEAAANALDVLSQISAAVQSARRAGPAPAAHLRALNAALDDLGMRAGLEADPVGRCVLEEIERLDAELAGVGGRLALAEFRALLAGCFEETGYVDAAIDSPVAMVPLAAAALRPFDAALLVGADARHLPSPVADSLFMSNAVRAELGLATGDDALRAQAAQLAALLSTVPRVVASWRLRRGDEPNALSPLLQRLQFVAARAFGDDLTRRVIATPHAVEPAACARPAPVAGELLPADVSASHAQNLVDCAYQFYARRMLKLAAPQDVIEMPDKRDFGEALHAVLRRFHRHWGAVDFDRIEPAQLADSLRLHADAVFRPQIERSPGMLAFARRFGGLVDDYVDWLRRHAAAGWRWSAGEVSHERIVELDGGRRVALRGRIDRIDVDARGELTIIDYKARSADRLRDALKSPGEDIQLPFYGLLLARRPASASYLSFDRGGEDRRGVDVVVPQQPFPALVEGVGARLRADLQRIAEGASLPAIGVEAVCQHCEMRGLCRRDHWQAFGSDARGGGDD